LVRAGAWGAPAIVIAGAAPAYAVSQVAPPLVTTSVSTGFSQATIGGVLRNYLDVTVLFANQNGQATTALDVVAEVVPVVGDIRTVVIYDTDQMWRWASSSSRLDGGVTAVFERNAPHLGGNPDTVTLFFRVWMQAPGSRGIVRVRPTPTPGAGVEGETEWPETLPTR
jgi:hypothetical protein